MSEYVPFGDEWKMRVSKLPKRELVEMLAKALREKQEVRFELLLEQQSRPTQRTLDECQEPCDLGGLHEFADPVRICSRCGTRRR